MALNVVSDVELEEKMIWKLFALNSSIHSHAEEREKFDE